MVLAHPMMSWTVVISDLISSANTKVTYNDWTNHMSIQEGTNVTLALEARSATNYFIPSGGEYFDILSDPRDALVFKQIDDYNNGTYSITFNLCHLGPVNLSVLLHKEIHAEHIIGSPFTLECVPGIINATTSTINRAEIFDAPIGVSTVFEISLLDSCGNKVTSDHVESHDISVSMISPSLSSQTLSYRILGTAQCIVTAECLPNELGRHTLEVLIDSQHLLVSPFSFNVTATPTLEWVNGDNTSVGASGASPRSFVIVEGVVASVSEAYGRFLARTNTIQDPAVAEEVVATAQSSKTTYTVLTSMSSMTTADSIALGIKEVHHFDPTENGSNPHTWALGTARLNLRIHGNFSDTRGINVTACTLNQHDCLPFTFSDSWENPSLYCGEHSGCFFNSTSQLCEMSSCSSNLTIRAAEMDGAGATEPNIVQTTWWHRHKEATNTTAPLDHGVVIKVGRSGEYKAHVSLMYKGILSFGIFHPSFNSRPLMVGKHTSGNVDWGTRRPHPAMETHRFFERAIGRIKRDEDVNVVLTGGCERHAMIVQTDGSIRLWLNSTLVIDTWMDYPDEWRIRNSTCHVCLRPGTFTVIRLDYRHDIYGRSGYDLLWGSVSRPMERISIENLFTEVPITNANVAFKVLPNSADPTAFSTSPKENLIKTEYGGLVSSSMTFRHEPSSMMDGLWWGLPVLSTFNTFVYLANAIGDRVQYLSETTPSNWPPSLGIIATPADCCNITMSVQAGLEPYYHLQLQPLRAGTFIVEVTISPPLSFGVTTGIESTLVDSFEIGLISYPVGIVDTRMSSFSCAECTSYSPEPVLSIPQRLGIGTILCCELSLQSSGGDPVPVTFGQDAVLEVVTPSGGAEQVLTKTTRQDSTSSSKPVSEATWILVPMASSPAEVSLREFYLLSAFSIDRDPAGRLAFIQDIEMFHVANNLTSYVQQDILDQRIMQYRAPPISSSYFQFRIELFHVGDWQLKVELHTTTTDGTTEVAEINSGGRVTVVSNSRKISAELSTTVIASSPDSLGLLELHAESAIDSASLCTHYWSAGIPSPDIAITLYDTNYSNIQLSEFLLHIGTEARPPLMIAVIVEPLVEDQSLSCSVWSQECTMTYRRDRNNTELVALLDRLAGASIFKTVYFEDGGVTLPSSGIAYETGKDGETDVLYVKVELPSLTDFLSMNTTRAILNIQSHSAERWVSFNLTDHTVSHPVPFAHLVECKQNANLCYHSRGDPSEWTVHGIRVYTFSTALWVDDASYAQSIFRYFAGESQSTYSKWTCGQIANKCSSRRPVPSLEASMEAGNFEHLSSIDSSLSPTILNSASSYWTATLVPQTSGSYTVLVEFVGYVEVYINNLIVLKAENPSVTSVAKAKGDSVMSFRANAHYRLEIYYSAFPLTPIAVSSQKSSWSFLRLFWSEGSDNPEPIPPELLFHSVHSLRIVSHAICMTKATL
eukprot:GHVT01102018.1.p1 GENE.GHVT01102018.1~~GHVT01102018.1.p1  ORF type:complete len:1443 (+),score=44.64 GHVT01102018.1:801-5129(+)